MTSPASVRAAADFEKNFPHQPGFWELNMSFRKSFTLTGSHHLDLRLETFNILNRARLGNAVSNPTLPDFAFITSRIGNRTTQLGAQYVF